MESFEHDGLTFEVQDSGPPGGEIVVLLHGFPQDHTCWRDVLPPLHAAGLRTLAPDQRGYSPRARPRARRAYDGDALVDDVVMMLDAFGVERAHVVGHDWGGAVAWGLADRRPDRVQSLTVLSTPHPMAFLGSMLRSSQLLRSWYMLAFQLPWLPERVLAHERMARGLERSGLPADHAAHYAHLLIEPGAAHAAVNWYRGLPFTLRRPVGPSRVPTSYVWGQGDAYLCRCGAELTARYAPDHDYRFVELDAGHWLPETRPAGVAQVVLDRVASTRPRAARPVLAS